MGNRWISQDIAEFKRTTQNCLRPLSRKTTGAGRRRRAGRHNNGGQQEPQSGSSVPSGYTLTAKFSSKDGKAKFRGNFVGKSGLAVEGNHEAV
jgi:hypothetical protein